MPSFVVHVGPHKTGTTYIQLRLQQNADKLRAQGIFVPLEWGDSPGNPSHTGLAKRLNADRLFEVEDVFRRFRASKDRLMVVSSEALLEKSDDALALLRNLLGDDPFTIVYYVRRWSELLYSAWHEGTVHGQTGTLLENAFQTVRRPNRSHFINIEIHMQRLIRAFGPSNIKLVSYSEVVSHEKDIFNHFANHFLGAPSLMPPVEVRANESFKPVEVELLRALNCLQQEGGHPPGVAVAERWRARRAQLDIGALLQHIDRFGKVLELSDNDEMIRPILERNRVDYGQFAVPPIGPKRFYRNATTQLRYYPGDYALIPYFPHLLRKFREDLLS